ncbi:MAG: biotin/lipoate A/B protein ligase family protein [Gemmataceae bacterium]
MTIRLLPHEIADGVWNMAADDFLLEAAAAGQAALRFYGWSQATVSLGYFQPERERRTERLESLPWVRRASGGLILVHHHELTYSLALPAGAPWRGADWRGWQAKMHAVIAAALDRLEVPVAVSRGQAALEPSAPLCFLAPTAGDLMIAASKVVGSAQRRQRGALLQHGAVLLAGSPFAPELPGLLELTGRGIEPAPLASAISTSLTEKTGWSLVPSAWSEAERASIARLVQTRHASAAWRQRR